MIRHHTKQQTLLISVILSRNSHSCHVYITSDREPKLQAYVLDDNQYHDLNTNFVKVYQLFKSYQEETYKHANKLLYLMQSFLVKCSGSPKNSLRISLHLMQNAGTKPSEGFIWIQNNGKEQYQPTASRMYQVFAYQTTLLTIFSLHYEILLLLVLLNLTLNVILHMFLQMPSLCQR